MKITIVILLCLSAVAILSCGESSSEAATWRGLIVAPEQSCGSAEARQDQYPPLSNLGSGGEIRDGVLATQGRYSPYTGEYFSSRFIGRIDSIIDFYEAIDSGLCDAPQQLLFMFLRDSSNFTLASSSTDDEKGDKDAAEWLPEFNQCWFVSKVIKVRQRYGLTIDRAEADAIDNVIMNCDHFELVYER